MVSNTELDFPPKHFIIYTGLKTSRYDDLYMIEQVSNEWEKTVHV